MKKTSWLSEQLHKPCSHEKTYWLLLLSVAEWLVIGILAAVPVSILTGLSLAATAPAMGAISAIGLGYVCGIIRMYRCIG